MNIIIQSLGFKASAALEAMITEKLNNLKAEKISNATVTLYKGPDSETASNYCEIRLDMPGNDPFVKHHNPHFEMAVSHCVDILQKMLQQQKQKYIRERKGSFEAIQDAINQGETDRDPELEDVVS